MSEATPTQTAAEVRPWQELVEAGRRAVERLGDAKWELGDLANEAAPLQTPGGSVTGAHHRLREFADEIGLPFDTLRGYRNVAAHWPHEERQNSLGWTAHRELLKADDPRRAMQEILTLDPPNGSRWTVAAIAEHIGKPVWGAARKTPRMRPPRTRSTPHPLTGRGDAASTIESLSEEAVHLRNWVAGAELEASEKADLGHRLDVALQALREARKRLL